MTEELLDAARELEQVKLLLSQCTRYRSPKPVEEQRQGHGEEIGGAPVLGSDA
jgi:hypothetical protein